MIACENHGRETWQIELESSSLSSDVGSECLVCLSEVTAISSLDASCCCGDWCGAMVLVVLERSHELGMANLPKRLSVVRLKGRERDERDRKVYPDLCASWENVGQR